AAEGLEPVVFSPRIGGGGGCSVFDQPLVHPFFFIVVEGFPPQPVAALAFSRPPLPGFLAPPNPPRQPPAEWAGRRGPGAEAPRATGLHVCRHPRIPIYRFPTHSVKPFFLSHGNDVPLQNDELAQGSDTPADGSFCGAGAVRSVRYGVQIDGLSLGPLRGDLASQG